MKKNDQFGNFDQPLEEKPVKKIDEDFGFFDEAPQENNEKSSEENNFGNFDEEK